MIARISAKNSSLNWAPSCAKWSNYFIYVSLSLSNFMCDFFKEIIRHALGKDAFACAVCIIQCSALMALKHLITLLFATHKFQSISSKSSVQELRSQTLWKKYYIELPEECKKFQVPLLQRDENTFRSM